MNKCFPPMLLFCVVCCFATNQGNIVAQVPCRTRLALHTCAREGTAPVDSMDLLAYVQQGLTDTVPATPAATKSYHYKVFKGADGRYGYDIFAGAKKLIHQPIIPGQPGNKGFARENDAAKVAGLVISKLQQNIFPPAVSTAELKQLGVRY